MEDEVNKRSEKFFSCDHALHSHYHSVQSHIIYYKEKFGARTLSGLKGLKRLNFFWFDSDPNSTFFK